MMYRTAKESGARKESFIWWMVTVKGEGVREVHGEALQYSKLARVYGGDCKAYKQDVRRMPPTPIIYTRTSGMLEELPQGRQASDWYADQAEKAFNNGCIKDAMYALIMAEYHMEAA